MRVSTLLQLMTAVLVMVTGLTAVVQPGTGIEHDGATYGAILVFFLAVSLIILRGRRTHDALLLLLAAAALLAYGQSMVMLLWDFTAFDVYNLGTPSAGDFTAAVLWAAAGTALLACGVTFGNRPSRSPAPEPKRPVHRTLFFRSRRFIIVCAYVGLLISLVLALRFDVGASGVSAGRLGWLANLFNSELLLLLTFVILLSYQDRVTRIERVLIVGAAALYVGLTVVQGSRGGLMVFAAMGLTVLLVQRGDFFLRRRVLLYLAAAAMITGFVIWPLATRIRGARISDVPLAMVQLEQAEVGTVWAGISFLYPILDRQGRVPQLIVVSNDWVPNAAREAPPQNILFHIVSGMVPLLSPDPATRPIIGRAYALIFQGARRDRIHADEWSPTALALFYLPNVGAVVLLFGWGWATGRVFRALGRHPRGYRLFLRAAFAYLLGFGMFAAAVVDLIVPAFFRWLVLSGLLLLSYQVLEVIGAGVRTAGSVTLPEAGATDHHPAPSLKS